MPRHQNLARFQEVHLNSDATFLSEILDVHLQFMRFTLQKKQNKKNPHHHQQQKTINVINTN